ncbi:hypothetical protein CERZMDRAFT_9178, partial [Cercospora zeae-maydis SCOH1-5]
LVGLINIFYIVYLNNILVYLKNKVEYNGYIRQVLLSINNIKLIYKIKSCLFY